MQGFGKINYNTGKKPSFYEGHFNCNYFDGYGRFREEDGWEYEGFWRNGMKNGYGQFKQLDGDDEFVYLGQFLNNEKHGYGELVKNMVFKNRVPDFGKQAKYKYIGGFINDELMPYYYSQESFIFGETGRKIVTHHTPPFSDDYVWQYRRDADLAQNVETQAPQSGASVDDYNVLYQTDREFILCEFKKGIKSHQSSVSKNKAERYKTLVKEKMVRIKQLECVDRNCNFITSTKKEYKVLNVRYSKRDRLLYLV